MRASYAVGIDVGGTRIHAALVDRKGRLVKDKKVLTPKNGPFGVIDTVIDSALDVMQQAHPSEIAGVGMGLPAQIDFARQSVEFCTNLPLTGVDVRALVMGRLKTSVTMDNDGHCAAVGEARFGAAKNARDFLMLTLGTGVGGAMFVDGHPYRGSRGLGGEIGHTVIVAGGLPCPCGGNGHLESYVSRAAIAKAARVAAGTFAGASIKRLAGDVIEDITAEHVLEAARAGDEIATGIIVAAAEILGQALVGAVNLLNPQLIILGGGLSESSDVFRQRAEEIVAAQALAGRRDVTIVRAELGNDAGALGAAALAFDEYESRETLHR